MIASTTELSTDRGIIKTYKCKYGFMCSTPDGMRPFIDVRAAGLYRPVALLFSNGQIILGKYITFYDSNNKPYRRQLREGDLVKGKNGNITVKKVLVMVHRKKYMYYIGVASTGGKYYIGDIIVS